MYTRHAWVYTRFVLIDPSLQQSGGHNLEYALHLLHTARDSGHPVFLATHRDFPRVQSAAMDWPVLPVFRFSLYRTRPIGELPAPRLFWRDVVSRWHSKHFLQDCERLFRSLPLTPGDMVFLPMLGGFELSALINFLSGAPWTQDVFWYVQFHYPPLQGSGAEVGHGANRDTLDKFYSGLVARVPEHRLHFFATTDSIAAQYRGLGLMGTRTLPYPADPGIRPERTGAVPAPLNLVLAGHLRREKSPQLLAGIVEALWQDFLASGQVRLLLQGRPGRIRRLLPRHIRPHLTEGSPALRPASGPVCVVPHPLSTAAYREHILNAQIGLMLYEPRAYYARCSGALVEFLCAGIPVVVPAGTWLADQITESIYQHHDTILVNASQQGWSGGAISPQTGACTGGELSVAGPQGGIVTEVELPPGARAMIVQGHWHTQETDGTYLRVEADLPVDGRQGLEQPSALLGHRAAGPVSAMFRCCGQGGGARLTWSTDTPSTPIHLSHIRLFFLTGDTVVMPPLGAVGLIAVSPAHAADCVADIVGHYAHYRATALHFSTSWRQHHSPKALLRTLEEAVLRAPGE